MTVSKKQPILAAFVFCILLFSAVASAAVTVYITDTGKRYHASACRHLKKSKIAISLEAAKTSGYTPCGVCNPPE